MKSFLHFIKWASISLFAMITIVIMSPFLLESIGFYALHPGWKVAEQLVADGKSVDECVKIMRVFWDVLSPPTTEQRMLCRYTYASLAKDPTACEGLMPSSYGLSCVGGARSVPQPCFLKPDLSVGGNGIRANLRECVSGPDDIKNNACCVISRVSSIVGQDDCSALNENPEMHDQCLNELAFKKKDPSFCQDILNENTRSACEVQTKALLKDPSICSGCIPAIALEEVFAL